MPELITMYNFYWERTRDDVSRSFLWYRSLTLLIHTFQVLISALDLFRLCLENHEEFCSKNKPLSYYAKWPIYMTHWSLIFNFIQAALGEVLVFKKFQERKVERTALSTNQYHVDMFNNTFYENLYLKLQSIATTLSLTVTLMYWALIFDSWTDRVDFLSVSEHGIGSVYMLLDTLVTPFPYSLSDGKYAMFVGLCYSLFTWLHYLSGSVDRWGKMPYVYSICDWAKPFETCLYLLLGHVLLFSVHGFLSVIPLLRIYCFRHINSAS